LQAWSKGETWKPKGSGFMGKAWDSWVPPPELWKEVIRVLKPGGHLISFAGSRTQDLMSISLRLAGFEVRDTIQWLYGSGFPKSLNIGKAIDKIQGNEREVVGCAFQFGITQLKDGKVGYGNYSGSWNITKGSSEYKGYGTALKPAFEPAILCRKPLDGTVAHNVLKHGVGGLNIDGCRIDTDDGDDYGRSTANSQGITGQSNNELIYGTYQPHVSDYMSPLGRWPSNVIMDEQVECGEWKRFFYCAKASRQEREQGLDGDGSRVNIHPTVKPIDLMRYLCRLITPRNGIILDPFLGSGSTGIAAGLEGFDFVGIEREEEYFEIAKTRIEHWTNTPLTYDQPQPKEVKIGEQLSLF
jgi:site-specific DNA-methyltransferase (adenine-specific)